MAQSRRDANGNLPIGPQQLAVIAALEHGQTRESAAAVARISRPTLYVWLKDETFLDMVVSAEDRAKAANIAIIERAAFAEGRTEDAKWWLERRYPQEFGKRVVVDVNLRIEAERIAAEYGLDPDEVLAEAERVLATGG